MMIRSIFLSLLCILGALNFAFSQSDYAKFDSLKNLVDKISHMQKTKSVAIIDEMYDIALQQPNNNLLLAKTIHSETLLKHRQGIADTALYNTIVEKLNSGHFAINEEIFLLSALGQNLATRRDYTEAFNVLLQTLEKAHQINDSLWVSRTLNSLGVICGNIYLRETASNYYIDALEWLPKSSKNFKFHIKNNLYNNYLNQSGFSNKADILDSLLLLIDEINEANMTQLSSSIYTNIITYYMNSTDPEKAYPYFLKIIELYEDNPYQYFSTVYNLGAYYWHVEKNNEKALSQFRKAKNFWEKNNDNRLLPIVYNSMSLLFENLHILDSALYYARKQQEIIQKNNYQAQIAETHRKYITTSLEASQNKLIIAQSDIILKNKQLLILVISISAIIIIMALLFIILWQKRKSMRQQVLLREAESKELMINLENERTIQRLQQEKLETQVREITSYSLLLSSKNNLLQQIQELIEQIPLHDEATREIAEKTKNIVTNNLHTESEWEDFMLHFDKVHPDFFDKLQTRYPYLTQNEIKLCAYIRIGMSIKQIARMLNLMPNSIKVNRYRLRQRLDIDKEQNLDDFIHAI